MYETLIQPARDAFDKVVLGLLPHPTPEQVGKFLLNFCSQGVYMTEPVPGWITRAGEKTKAMGMVELGQALIVHAKHEEGHHELFINDVASLVVWYNAHFIPQVTAKEYLDRPPAAGALAYAVMHESYIAGTTPYCQLAIEYEIERVSVERGPQLFAACSPEMLGCLSFVKEHAAIDVGHTQYNRRAMQQFLTEYPGALEPLVLAGGAALTCYGEYLQDCVRLSTL